MKNEKRILITLGIAGLIIISFFMITNAITKYTGFSISIKEESFESCLEKQDIVLYVNTNNLEQTLKDIELFDYLQYFEIINCLDNNIVCLDNGVDSFPSWVINRVIVKSDINLNKLEELSNCDK